MGVYLSTPCRDVESGSGEAAGVRFGYGEMQGWRRSMEDAHVTIPSLKEVHSDDENGDSDASLFAVFDGHGGKEVAKFCQDRLASVLIKSAHYKENDYEQALKFAFHHLDEMLEDEANESKLELYRQIPNPASKMEDEAPADTSTPQDHNKNDADAVVAAVAGGGGGNDDDESPIELNNGNIVLSQEQVMKFIQQMYGVPARSIGEEAEEVVEEEDVDHNEQNGHDHNENEHADDDEQGHENDEEVEAKSQEQQADCDESEAQESGSKLGHTGQSVDDLALERKPNGGEVLSATMNALDLNGGQTQPDTAPTQPVRNIHGCTLSDHRVIAGCTAVVAYRKGNVMYVANAGDSRAVLCRAGTAVALSVDHKPSQQRERRRIVNAGGFVNGVGRVNGNLNLSRSIGDLKYKTNREVSRADQIISAEPDIVRVELTKLDEFLILGCDGIWDCKTNQQAVDFVRERLQRGMSLQDITEAMCHDCLADDPRRTTGIGADNMTFVVVEFLDRENWPAPPEDMLNVALPDPEL